MQDLPDLAQNLLSIGKAAKVLGVSIDTIRRWETKGKIKVIRTPGGTRFISLEEIERLKNAVPIPTLSFVPETPSTETVTNISRPEPIALKSEEIFPISAQKIDLLNQDNSNQPRWKRLIKYRPSWWHAYRGHPMSDYLNWAALAVVTLLIGLGLFQELFVPKPVDIGNLKSSIEKGLVLAATPPRILSFQGRLTNASGVPTTIATNVVFKIYTVRTGGAATWTSKTWSVLPDSNGIFSVCLGGQDTSDDCLSGGTESDPYTADTVIPSTLFADNAALYLGVTIGGDSEATPRQRIASSTYALNSDALEGFHGSQSPAANQVPVLDGSGNLAFAGAASITTASGNLTIDSAGTFVSSDNIDFNGSGTNDIAGTLNLSGNALTSTGDMTITPGGGALTIALGGAAADDFIVDSTTLVVESDNNRVGIGDAAPSTQLVLGGTGSANGITLGDDAADPVNLYRYGANVLATDDMLIVESTIFVGTSGTSTDDSIIYFDNVVLPESLTWDDDPGKFIFSDDLQIDGALQGGVVTTSTTDSGTTSTISTSALAYYVESTDTSGTCVTASKTFNITGLTNAEGFFAYIVSKATDGGCSSSTLTVTVSINGSTISTVANSATNNTITESYLVAYINAAWRVVAVNSATAGGSDTFDLAEWIQFSGEKPTEGDVLSIANSSVKIQQTSTPYDQNLIGVVSTNPHTTMGTSSDDSVRLALAGRVPTKVSTENGPIAPGDPITSSSIPGVGMKATASGPIVGKALESFTCDKARPCQGKIVVFVSVGWYVAPISNNNPPTAKSNLDGLNSISTQSLTSKTLSADKMIIGGKIDFNRSDLIATESAKLINSNSNELIATLSAHAKTIWINSAGQIVAWVTDAGEAVFKSVTATLGEFTKLVFGEAVVKKEAKTAGEASFAGGETEVFVESDKVNEESLINLTSSTKTNGLSLYIKEKRSGEGFVVALERNSGDLPEDATASATASIKFTWFILNQE